MRRTMRFGKLCEAVKAGMDRIIMRIIEGCGDVGEVRTVVGFGVLGFCTVVGFRSVEWFLLFIRGVQTVC